MSCPINPTHSSRRLSLSSVQSPARQLSQISCLVHALTDAAVPSVHALAPATRGQIFENMVVVQHHWMNEDFANSTRPALHALTEACRISREVLVVRSDWMTEYLACVSRCVIQTNRRSQLLRKCKRSTRWLAEDLGGLQGAHDTTTAPTLTLLISITDNTASRAIAAAIAVAQPHRWSFHGLFPMFNLHVVLHRHPRASCVREAHLPADLLPKSAQVPTPPWPSRIA